MTTLIFSHLLGWWVAELAIILEHKRRRDRAWALKNPDKKAAAYARYSQADPKRAAQRTRQYREDNPQKVAESNKRYCKDNRKAVTERKRIYETERRRRDVTFRVLKNMRRRIQHVLRGDNKAARTIELLGCPIEQLRSYLEARFKPGMSWDNYGPGWHVDHIRPCISFDLTQPEQQKQCFHFSNLQPLWATENLRKGSRA